MTCGDDDAVEFAAEFLHALDFQAEHGQALGQFLRRPVEIDVLLEPVKSDFHLVRPRRRKSRGKPRLSDASAFGTSAFQGRSMITTAPACRR